MKMEAKPQFLINSSQPPWGGRYDLFHDDQERLDEPDAADVQNSSLPDHDRRGRASQASEARNSVIPTNSYKVRKVHWIS